MSTTPTTASTGVTLISSDISLTRPGRLARAICGSTMRRKRCPARMPTACAASYWSFGKCVERARQTSQLNAEVFITSARIAAEIGPIGTPTFGRAKNKSSSSVTSGVARSMLT